MAYDPSKWYSYCKERSSNGDVEEIVYNASHSDSEPYVPSRSSTTEEQLEDVRQQIKEKEQEMRLLGYRQIGEEPNQINLELKGENDIFGQPAQENQRFQECINKIQKMVDDVPG